jgi:hypothetical protein|tara:strand:- start:2411 stop:2596 length:186 start_codon:yes stop_codon:yes gene_type:complete
MKLKDTLIDQINNTTYTIYIVVEKDNEQDLPRQVHTREMGKYKDHDEAVKEANMIIDDYIL